MAVVETLYPYVPTKVAPVVYYVLFTNTAIIHLVQTKRLKSWSFTALFPWAGFLYTSGFVLRFVSTWHPDNLGLFIASLVLIFLAAPVYSACNYFILGRSLYYIPYLSPIHPGRVVTTFVGLDVVVGVLTGQGASRIAQWQQPDQVHIGSILIKASLLLQVALFCGFITIEVAFHRRCIRAGVMNSNLKTIIHLLYVSSGLILFRNVYRAVDAFVGSGGYLDTHEVFIYVFDALPMLLNSFMMNYWHPAKYLPPSNKIYLSKDGSTELTGPGWVDPRNFFLTLIDPFDIVGLIRGRDNETRFWDREDEHTRARDGNITGVMETAV